MAGEDRARCESGTQQLPWCYECSTPPLIHHSHHKCPECGHEW